MDIHSLIIVRPETKNELRNNEIPSLYRYLAWILIWNLFLILFSDLKETLKRS